VQPPQPPQLEQLLHEILSQPLQLLQPLQLQLQLHAQLQLQLQARQVISSPGEAGGNVWTERSKRSKPGVSVGMIPPADTPLPAAILWFVRVIDDSSQFGS
jgi:hypothetical protein